MRARQDHRFRVVVVVAFFTGYPLTGKVRAREPKIEKTGISDPFLAFCIPFVTLFRIYDERPDWVSFRQLPSSNSSRGLHSLLSRLRG